MIKQTLLKAISSIVIFSFLMLLPIQHVNAKEMGLDSQTVDKASYELEFNWSEITSQMALTSPQSYDSVQVFDVNQGHVVKTINNSKKIQRQVKRILKEVYEFAPELQPDMKAKYIIRIPVKQGTSVTINQTSLSINELFIFYYVDKEPLLLVFDENKKPFLFHTKHSIEPLLNIIQVE